MGKSMTGPANPNWRGGRSVTSDGYVIIRVGIEHHLADVRGYAYEHRLVGEEIVGRRLREGEEVHHRDDSFEGRSNNDPANLEVHASHAHHMLRHRSKDRGDRPLREPGEPNPVVQCACGCETMFDRFDSSGRRRMYVPGHNEQQAPSLDAVVESVSFGAASVADVVEMTGLTRGSVRLCLSKAAKLGLVVRRAKGLYGPPGAAIIVPRVPTEIACACGCGERLTDLDRYGRERRFVSGHNARRTA